MPRIYLDPSVNEFNEFVGGGSEEYYMNLIADAMIPYLRLVGIDFTRNNPDDTQRQTIENSNAEYFDLHLSLRASAAPEGLQGPNVYYYTFSPDGQRAAYYITRNLWIIYPNPDLVDLIPNTTMVELRTTRAVTVIADLGNSRNGEDADWIRDDIFKIARRLVLALTEYFEIPFATNR